MTLVLEESEDISSDLLHCLLSSVKKENKVNLYPVFFFSSLYGTLLIFCCPHLRIFCL